MRSPAYPAPVSLVLWSSLYSPPRPAPYLCHFKFSGGKLFNEACIIPETGIHKNRLTTLCKDGVAGHKRG